jgi:hypothetical protein
MRAWFGERVDGEVAHDATVKPVARFIAATTSPQDKIFVWGFSPWLYQYSGRRPAGRYVFETYVTGFVPWFWASAEVERARVVPGSLEALVYDLERERPAIVVDAGSIMIARPMRAYDRAARFLRAHYCFEVRLGGFDVYRRTPDGGPCANPWFPKPHSTLDWRGHPIPAVRVLRPVDDEWTRNLPPAGYFQPVWMAGSPTPRNVDALVDPRRRREDAAWAADGFVVDDVDWPDERP